MPIYEYQAKQKEKSCPSCLAGFEMLRNLSDPPLETCPQCGHPVVKMISAPAVGASNTGYDQRAKAAGFHKLKKLGKGEYEKQY